MIRFTALRATGTGRPAPVAPLSAASRGKSPGWLLQVIVPLLVLGVAVAAGMATAVVGGRAGDKSIYYALVFGALGAGGILAVTRDEPLRLAYFLLLLCLPIVNLLVPPGRFGITIFDAVTLAAAVILIGKRLVAVRGADQKLIPGRSIGVAWALALPCVALSLYPGESVRALVLVAGMYAFFLMTLRELERPAGFGRVVGLLAVAVLVIDAGLFIDHFLRINLSMRGSNLNQASFTGGMQVWRAGGFFQDPQVAGAFLSCSITFLLLLLVRGRFRGTRLAPLIGLAVIVSFAALLTTVSRAAILGCVAVSLLALFAFNRWSGPVKLLSAGGVLLLAASLPLIPQDLLVEIAPRAVAERFSNLGESFEDRLHIWFDTWDMFAEHPLTGIGMSSFRPYLMDTRPGVVNFYGIGAAAGVVYIPNQPENGYLKVLYEGGLAGSIGVLVFVIDTLRRALRSTGSRLGSPEARTECIAALAGLANFAVTFLTLFTLADTRMSALFMLLLAVLWRRSLEQERQPPEGRR